MIFAMLVTLLGARFGRCVRCVLFVRIDTDTYDDSATAMAATTRTDISQSPSSPSTSPPLRPLPIRLLCFCVCFCFCPRSAYFARLPRWFACCFVHRTSSTCFRCGLSASVAVAATGSGSGCTRAAAVGSAERDTRTYVTTNVCTYSQPGRQESYKRISRNWSNPLCATPFGSVRFEAVACGIM